MSDETFTFEKEPDLVEQLKSFREDWHDEVPEKTVHSTDADNHYKVRNAWFNNVGVTLYLLDMDGRITGKEAKEAIEEFNTTFTSDNFKDRGKTTAEDIKKANGLVDIVLESLKP